MGCQILTSSSAAIAGAGLSCWSLCVSMIIQRRHKSLIYFTDEDSIVVISISQKLLMKPICAHQSSFFFSFFSGTSL